MLARKCVVYSFGERAARGGDGIVDIVFAVGNGHKSGFKRRRRQIHALFQHQVEEALEALNVALHHVLIAGDAFGVGKEEAEHAANVIHHQRNARVARGVQQPLGQLVG
ncbi:Uncharacterised protein [Raoultella terrigena]|nr:Uncharacterised protein [Raoultella terrigena]